MRIKLLLLVSTIVLTSCTSPLQKPAELISESILPEYINYVNNDPNLTTEKKERRLRAVKAFVEAVNSGK